MGDGESGEGVMKYRYPKQEYLDWLDRQNCPSVSAIGFAVLNEVKKRMSPQVSGISGRYLSQTIDHLIDEWFTKGENHEHKDR
jgi:hypothetical protein